MIINWPGLNNKEKAEQIPTFSITDNWILLTHPLGTRNKSQPPFKESQRIARADGKYSRHKVLWREGKDELATHSMTTEVWINTRGQIQEATRMAIQDALEQENTKDTPSLGTEDLEVIHRSGFEAGLLAYTTSQEQYMPQTDRMIRGFCELATSNWTNTEAIPLTGLY